MYVYIYIYIYVYVCVYIYIYIYDQAHERDQHALPRGPRHLRRRDPQGDEHCPREPDPEIINKQLLGTACFTHVFLLLFNNTFLNEWSLGLGLFHSACRRGWSKHGSSIIC